MEQTGRLEQWELNLYMLISRKYQNMAPIVLQEKVLGQHANQNILYIQLLLHGAGKKNYPTNLVKPRSVK